MTEIFRGPNATAEIEITCFDDWNERSAVRSRIYAYDCSSINTKPSGKTWFVPAALPYLEHPALKELGSSAQQNMLARNLVFFLEYTTLLEHRIVNRSAELIAHDYLSVPIPLSMRMDALKLYADEGYHAVISADVARQVANIHQFRIPAAQFERIDRLEDLAANADEKFNKLGWFLIGFVSETVITKEFLRIAKSTIVAPVYNMLRDHLEDEWIHGRYFSEMFSYLWPRLSKPEKDFCANQLPLIILECFRLEKNWLAANLVEIGVEPSIAVEICGERGSEHNNRMRASQGIFATLKALQRTTFFSNTAYVKRFCDLGLIEMERKRP